MAFKRIEKDVTNVLIVGDDMFLVRWFGDPESSQCEEIVKQLSSPNLEPPGMDELASVRV